MVEFEITQLTLHAGLGAITSKISGGDYLSGAVSGVVGELTAELIGEKYYDGKDSLTDKQKENITNISGLIAGLSSIVVSKSQGQDIEDITTNAYVGQRIGQTVSKNNYLLPEEKAELVKELKDCGGDKSCKRQVQGKYKYTSDMREIDLAQAKLNCSMYSKDCGIVEKFYNEQRLKLTEEGNKYFKEHPEDFKQLSDDQSIYHTFKKDKKGNVINVTNGAEQGYTKYIDKVRGYEVVLDSKGNIVTDHVNLGTYNYYNPNINDVEYNPLINGTMNHIFYDVIPYYQNGNSSKDATTTSQRILRNIYYFKNKNK